MYRGFMSHDIIWRKTDFLFQKRQKFGEFWPKHSKVSKICTLIGSFCAKYITLDLKSIEELSFVTLKSDPKFGEKVTCGLEYDMRNFANLHQSTQNWEKLILSSKV